MDSEGDLVAAIENNELVTHDFMTFGPFAMTEKGLTKNITYRNKVIPGVKVAAPFKVIGYCRDPHGEAWGKMISFYDADGRLSHDAGTLTGDLFVDDQRRRPGRVAR
jgi:hypothetical protein